VGMSNQSGMPMKKEMKAGVAYEQQSRTEREGAAVLHWPFTLFPLDTGNCFLNNFDYVLYLLVFWFHWLSMKHGLSDFLLPNCCHTYMAAAA
jgi:hypothetical protein